MSDRIRVLLADESQAVRLLVASMLLDDGRFDVVAQVATGAEALSHRDEVDLVLTDLVLQDTDAFSVIEDLHAVAPALPVVIVAAVDPPYLRDEADARGAAGFFRHDMNPGQLLDSLVAVASRAERR